MNLLKIRICWFGLVMVVRAVSILEFGIQAAVYYVSPHGNDAFAGTESQPFRQIRRGVAQALAGDTVLVADGSYLGFDVFDKVGTANLPITVRALGTNAVVVATTDRSDNRDTIRIED